MPSASAVSPPAPNTERTRSDQVFPAAGSDFLEGSSRTRAMIVRRDTASDWNFTVRGVSMRVPWTLAAPARRQLRKSPLMTSRVPSVTSAGVNEWIESGCAA